MSIPRLSQETLAAMVGTTRSRISFFMNQFRKRGFIHYAIGDSLRVHSSLLNVVLQDTDDMTVNAKRRNSSPSVTKEPPTEPGEPADKDRAKGPPLSGMAQRVNASQTQDVIQNALDLLG